MKYQFIISDNTLSSYIPYNDGMPKVYTTQDNVVMSVDEFIEYSLFKGIDFSLLVVDELVNPNLLSSLFEIKLDEERSIKVLSNPVNYKSKKIYISLLLQNETEDNRLFFFSITNDKIIQGNVGEFDYFYNLIIEEEKSLKEIISSKILEMESNNKFE